MGGVTVSITLPPLPHPVDELWHVLLDLGERLDVPWALIGGQMVLLHALEHGTEPPLISQDGDIIADIRAAPNGLVAVVRVLEEMGFQADRMSADGLAHRYARASDPRPVSIDVLAPEGVGERANLQTSPPGRTVEVPGGSQALQRVEFVTVEHEGRTGTVPRPTLLAAVVGKAAATALPGPERHYRDLALLLGLVADPFDLREQIDRKDLQRLRSAHAVADENHPAWGALSSDARANGLITYAVLTD